VHGCDIIEKRHCASRRVQASVIQSRVHALRESRLNDTKVRKSRVRVPGSHCQSDSSHLRNVIAVPNIPRSSRCPLPGTNEITHVAIFYAILIPEVFHFHREILIQSRYGHQSFFDDYGRSSARKDGYTRLVARSSIV